MSVTNEDLNEVEASHWKGTRDYCCHECQSEGMYPCKSLVAIQSLRNRAERLEALYEATKRLNSFRPSLADMTRLGDTPEHDAIVGFWAAHDALSEPAEVTP